MEGTIVGADMDIPDSRHLKRAAGLVPIQFWIPKERKHEAMALIAPLVLDGKNRVEALKSERRKERRAARLRAELSKITG